MLWLSAHYSTGIVQEVARQRRLQHRLPMTSARAQGPTSEGIPYTRSGLQLRDPFAKSSDSSVLPGAYRSSVNSGTVQGEAVRAWIPRTRAYDSAKPTIPACWDPQDEYLPGPRLGDLQIRPIIAAYNPETGRGLYKVGDPHELRSQPSGYEQPTS